MAVARTDRRPVRLRIVIDDPVAGVRHSLQEGDRKIRDPKDAVDGQPLTFDFAVEVEPGPTFFGPQVRREGPVRRFVYIRVGAAAGDHGSPWSRRMKVNIHDIDPALIDAAAVGQGVLALHIHGTGKDGTPACASVPVLSVRLLEN